MLFFPNSNLLKSFTVSNLGRFRCGLSAQGPVDDPGYFQHPVFGICLYTFDSGLSMGRYFSINTGLRLYRNLLIRHFLLHISWLPAEIKFHIAFGSYMLRLIHYSSTWVMLNIMKVCYSRFLIRRLSYRSYLLIHKNGTTPIKSCNFSGCKKSLLIYHCLSLHIMYYKYVHFIRTAVFDSLPVWARKIATRPANS